MIIANISTEDQGIGLLFNEQEIECLEKINERKLANKNIHKPKTTKWAYWVIGRLGGWKDDNKKRKAGPITLQKGLVKFYEIYEGWKSSIN